MTQKISVEPEVAAPTGDGLVDSDSAGVVDTRADGGVFPLRDRSAPLHAALGGDFSPAVEAAAEVVVVVLRVFGDKLEAVSAVDDLVRVVGVDRGHGVVAAERPVLAFTGTEPTGP